MKAPLIVDLRSDTVSKPTPEMRKVMAAAEVGDDVFQDDPTVNRLEEKMADVFGKEASLFVPTGTMANLVSVLAQTHPGETLLLHPDAHPFRAEAANVAVVGGLLVKTVPGELGIMNLEQLTGEIVRDDNVHHSETTLIAVENTTNAGGGNVYPLERIQRIGALAKENDMRVHCDGARIFNASVASGDTPARIVRDCDTVSACFSKGLGCPAGSIVAGEASIIKRARKLRKMLGGGMRQVGILAAAAEHAVDNHVERLADDHRHVQRFRDAFSSIEGISFPLPTPTNILYIDVDDAASFVGKLEEKGVRMLAFGPKRIRAVFHLDVDDAGVEKCIDECGQLLEAGVHAS